MSSYLPTGAGSQAAIDALNKFKMLGGQLDQLSNVMNRNSKVTRESLTPAYDALKASYANAEARAREFMLTQGMGSAVTQGAINETKQLGSQMDQLSAALSRNTKEVRADAAPAYTALLQNYAAVEAKARQYILTLGEQSNKLSGRSQTSREWGLR